jgi:hypothetical protein
LPKLRTNRAQFDLNVPVRSKRQVIERAPISPAPPKEPLPLKRYTICGIGGPCWEVVGRPLR